MLILKRRRSEAIMIGDHIAVTILDIKGYQVRVGIQAPKDIPVHRQEVFEKIQREQARPRLEQGLESG